MSAGEVERLVSELSGGTGGDEEEEWLYGDENEVERPEEENASANPPSGVEDETAENGVPKPKVTETEDDSDSDSDDDEDDVHVTIGDIKTGAPQYGSYGTAPVNLNIKTGGRVYGTTGTKVKGVDLDAPGSINGVPLLEVDLDSFEDKPWRKPGADLSDYFNYGFNEDTWKAYCEKQKRIRMGLEVIPVTSTTNKITVQQGRTGNSEKETALPSTKAEFTSPPSLFKTGLPPSRRLPGAIDVIGQTITISRVEGRRRANENSNIQVLSERSATEVDNNFSKPPPFFPPGAPPTHLPPPPFLPPPPSVSTAPPLIPPPGFPPPPGAPPPSLIPTIESGHSSGYDSRSARAFPYSNDEERYRYREYAERGYERHRASREKEERHRERRHREKEETRHKSSRSNSRRRHESEEGDSHRRHKHKKSKRSKEGKEAGSEPAPEQESTEAAPAE
uniref:Pre-mRNA 3'-end-processing factor FIP1 n=1 Tax=Propithecus coquereli TaxID=379532 RepID=A0A2K6FXQ2_PROCO